MKRYSIPVQVGQVIIGGNAPIVVQSMTNTATENITATVKQIQQLAQAGSEVVRITVNTEEAAQAVPYIIERLGTLGCHVPVVGDFHYNGHLLLSKYPDCAKALAKYRINPGNVGFGKKKDTQFAMMIEQALLHDKPVRIGVNWGSLDQDLLASMMDENAKKNEPLGAELILREALIRSALDSAQYAQDLGLPENKIIVSCKVSSVPELIAIHRDLAKRCTYPIHVGLTEAGMGSKGIVATTAALSVLLQEGIGDTIRASLTPDPNGDRTLEAIVCQEILQTLGLRAFTPMVSACPGCGRTTSTLFQELAAEVQSFVRAEMPLWKQKYDGVENLSLAVMGCIVNGPGESKHANIGISLPGTGEAPVMPVFQDGKKTHTLRGDNITEDFKMIIRQYVEEHYTAK